MLKCIVKDEPVKYVVFRDGEELAADEIRLTFSCFDWNTENELREYEIVSCNSVLSVLVKYGYLYNWRGSRMANMYKLADSYTELSTLLDAWEGESVSVAVVAPTPVTEGKDVHTEHCCARHGCKYGDENCTVASGLKQQSYPCESCDFERESVQAMLNSDPKYKVAYESNPHFKRAVTEAVKAGVFEAMYLQSVVLENVVSTQKNLLLDLNKELAEIAAVIEE